MPVRLAVHGSVVHKDKLAVLCAPNVQLHVIAAKLDRLLEGRDCVFGRELIRSAVGDHDDLAGFAAFEREREHSEQTDQKNCFHSQTISGAVIPFAASAAAASSWLIPSF